MKRFLFSVIAVSLNSKVFGTSAAADVASGSESCSADSLVCTRARGGDGALGKSKKRGFGHGDRGGKNERRVVASDSCADSDRDCEEWAGMGECDANPG